VSLIVAVARNSVIGRDGGLPWHLPDDMRHFRRTTLDKAVLMGRVTHASIGKPLERRLNVVLSRDHALTLQGCLVAHSFRDALIAAREYTELVVIGGAAVYASALAHATRVYLTRVHANVIGDVFFPELDPTDWKEVEHTEHAADDRHTHAFSISTLQRVSPDDDNEGNGPQAASGHS
jgi:dihydrofolate reductase